MFQTLEAVFKDVAYGVRHLLKSPGFALLSIFTLALGVAATSTIFSIVNAILLRKPAVHDADRIVVILSTNSSSEAGDASEERASLPDFLAWRERYHQFNELSAVLPSQDFTLYSEGEPGGFMGLQVSANFFNMLGIAAARGRTFTPEEEAPGQNHVAVISDAMWRSRFGLDPNILGKRVRLNDELYTVIGVMPAAFRLLSFPADIWVPLAIDSNEPKSPANDVRSLYVLGRVASGSTVVRAQEEASAIARQLEQERPADKGWGVKVLTLQEFQIRDMNSRNPVLVLMFAVGLVLAIACTNVAGLLLAKAEARTQEFALRVTLGARRLRLIGQLMAEVLPIALLGSGLGLVFTFGGVSALHNAISFNDSLALVPLNVDAHVVAFTIIISFVSLLLVGLAPAFQLSKLARMGTNESGRTATSGKRRQRMRRVLVIGQIALSIVLAMSAGLSIVALVDEMRTSPGFNPNQLLTAAVSLPKSKYPTSARQIAFAEQALERVQNLPGVRSAALTRTMPAAAETPSVEFQIQGMAELSKNAHLHATHYVVSPTYLETMEIPLIAGRNFTRADTERAPAVVLINQSFSHKFFGDGNAVGRFVALGDDAHSQEWREIVGVVGNVLDSVGLQPPHPQLYQPYQQAASYKVTIAFRSRVGISQLASSVRQAIWSVDPELPLTHMMTMQEMMDVKGGGAGDRLVGQLLGIFAFVALVLTTVGVYGIVLYSANQRTRDIGIRLALGAGKFHIAGLVIREGAGAAAVGLGIGWVLAFPLPSLFSSIFEGFHVNPMPTLTIVSSLVVMITFSASCIPAQKAVHVDPIATLRNE